jgi:hypothetical protein
MEESKTVYQTDENGLFLHPTAIYSSLIPYRAHEEAPPQAGINEVAVFDPVSSAWTLQPDYRGTKRYSTIDGSEQEIKETGPLAEVAPPDTTDTPMPAPPTGKKTIWNGTAWAYEDLPPPAQVTMRQARLALMAAGLYEQVNAAVAAMVGIKGKAAAIEWEFGGTVERDSEIVQGLAGALGLSDETLDALFRQAATL